MQPQPVESLLRSLRWLQTSREYSDLKIICGRKTFQVHKAIVCPRSKYFATSCRWTQDGKVKDEIRLDDDDPTIVGLMIDYLYQMDYDDILPSNHVTSPMEETVFEEALAEEISPIEELASEEPATEAELLTAGSVSYHGNFGFGPIETDLPAAENEYISEPEVPTTENRYMIEPEAEADVLPETPAVSEDEWNVNLLSPRNKSKKAQKKKRASDIPSLEPDSEDLSTARLTINALVYALADKYEIDNLKDIAKSKFETAVLQDWKTPAFAYAAELVSSTTPTSDQGLRSIVINTINQHRELVNYGEIQSLLDSGNGMAWALVQVLLSGQAQQRHVENFYPRYRNHR